MSDSWGYLVFSFALFLLCSVAAVSIALTHVYFVTRGSDTTTNGPSDLRRVSTNSNEVRSKTKSTFERMQQLHEEQSAWWRVRLHKAVVHYGTWAAILGYTAMPVISALLRMSHLGWFGSLTFGCRQTAFTLTAFWILAKNAMYSVFIARVCTTFKDSTHRYSLTVINSLYVVVLISFLMTEAMIPVFIKADNKQKADFTTTGHRLEDDSDRVGMIVCVPKISRILIAYVAIMDVAFTSLLLAMFIRPLRKVLEQMHNESEKDSAAIGSKKVATKQLEMELLPLKYTVLCATAVLSTILCMLVSATARFNALTMLDAVVNMSCLLLMSRFWKLVYWRLCAPLLRCISIGHLCVDAQTKENIHAMISAFS